MSKASLMIHINYLRLRWMRFCFILILVSAGGVTNAEEKIKLHVWGANLGHPRYGWYAVVDSFEQMYPNVDVILGPTDRGEDLQKLLSGIVGNSPPDVFRRESHLFYDIAARGILMPLDEFIKADRARPDGLHEEDYLPAAWQSGRYNDRIYGIPEALAPLVMAYNRKVFREAGLDPDKPPRTWDEWLEFTRMLTFRDESGRVTRLGSLFHTGRDDLSFYMAQFGADVFSEDGRKCHLNSPEGIKTLTFLKSLFDANGGREAYDKFVAANSASTEQYDPFGLGKIAMSIQDDWVIYRIMRFSPDMELGIAPVPAPTGCEPITTSSTTTIYMIPINARHPEGAWDFIRFINSPKGQLTLAHGIETYIRRKGETHNYTGFRPNRKVFEALSARYAPRKPLFRECFYKCQEILESLVPHPQSPVMGVMRDEMRRAVDRVAYGTMAPEQALEDTNRRVQQQLDLFYGRQHLPLFRWKFVWMALLALIVAVIGIIYFYSRGERARSKLQRRENIIGPIFISPWVIGFLVFIAGPMVFSIAISFCDYDVIHRAKYVGLSNYVSLLMKDPLFWKSLRNTAFMVLALPLGMMTSLSIALLLNTKVKGMSFYRTIFYLPAITPAVATAVLWYALLNPEGLINAGLNATIGNWFGITAPAWLQDPNWSKPAMVLMGLWGAGGGMILWLAGLQGIPQQLYEAAAIDGAGPIRRFWSITLPMLTPYIFFSLIVGVIGVFQIFGQALILTQGGPADSTLFYVYYLFNNAFRYFKMGYASAQAWILFIIILVLTLLQWRTSKKWVHYG